MVAKQVGLSLALAFNLLALVHQIQGLESLTRPLGRFQRITQPKHATGSAEVRRVPPCVPMRHKPTGVVGGREGRPPTTLGVYQIEKWETPRIRPGHKTDPSRKLTIGSPLDWAGNNYEQLEGDKSVRSDGHFDEKLSPDIRGNTSPSIGMSVVHDYLPKGKHKETGLDGKIDAETPYVGSRLDKSKVYSSQNPNEISKENQTHDVLNPNNLNTDSLSRNKPSGDNVNHFNKNVERDRQPIHNLHPISSELRDNARFNGDLVENNFSAYRTDGGYIENDWSPKNITTNVERDLPFNEQSRGSGQHLNSGRHVDSSNDKLFVDKMHKYKIKSGSLPDDGWPNEYINENNFYAQNKERTKLGNDWPSEINTHKFESDFPLNEQDQGFHRHSHKANHVDSSNNRTSLDNKHTYKTGVENIKDYGSTNGYLKKDHFNPTGRDKPVNVQNGSFQGHVNNEKSDDSSIGGTETILKNKETISSTGKRTVKDEWDIQSPTANGTPHSKLIGRKSNNENINPAFHSQWDSYSEDKGRYSNTNQGDLYHGENSMNNLYGNSKDKYSDNYYNRGSYGRQPYPGDRGQVRLEWSNDLSGGTRDGRKNYSGQENRDPSKFEHPVVEAVVRSGNKIIKVENVTCGTLILKSRNMVDCDQVTTLTWDPRSKDLELFADGMEKHTWESPRKAHNDNTFVDLHGAITSDPRHVEHIKSKCRQIHRNIHKKL